MNFRRVPSIEGKIIKVDKSTFKSWEEKLSGLYLPNKYKFEYGIDGIVTYIYFNGVEKKYKWWEDSIPLELEQMYDLSLKIKKYVKHNSGKSFLFGIEGKLFAEFLEDRVEQSEMTFIRSFYDNIKNQNVEIRARNKILLSNSLDRAHYELIQQDNEFKSIRLIYEEF